MDPHELTTTVPDVAFHTTDIRSERLDWRALSDGEQLDVAMYRASLLTLKGCRPRAKVYVRRHVHLGV
jgi:hypothetical protein